MDLAEAARVLGVEVSETPHVVKRQYRRLARATHPDRHPGIDAARFRRVREAWERFQLAWEIQRAEAVPPPPEPTRAVRRMSIAAWLRDAGGIDARELARDLVDSGSLISRLSQVGPNPIPRVCDLYLRNLVVHWPTLSSSFRSWFQSEIVNKHTKSWMDAIHQAMNPRELEYEVYTVLLEHVVWRTPTVRPIAHAGQVEFTEGEVPVPQYSDEVKKVGLETAIRNRVALEVDRRIRRNRLPVIDSLESALADPIALIRRWSYRDGRSA